MKLIVKNRERILVFEDGEPFICCICADDLDIGYTLYDTKRKDIMCLRCAISPKVRIENELWRVNKVEK